MMYINPWYFYLSNFSGNLWILSVCVFSVAIIGVISFTVGWVCENDWDNNLTKFLKKMSKISIIAAIVSAIFMTILPSEDTINKMIIASFVTKENVAEAKIGAKELVDYIVEKAIELKNAESKDTE